MQKLLCNNCGLVFKAFDPLGTQKRAPSKKGKQHRGRNRRRGPRFYAHLPAAISLIDDKGGGKGSYSQPSRGQCETISKFGMRLSLVGTRFTEAELSQIGRLLFVRVDLPEGPIEGVVTIVSSERGGEATQKRWTLGVNIQQISDADRERLADYLAKRGNHEPVVISD
ncbi:MAG TPA: PilZ domain-containing protein [Pyrinomonadaceae bacterium]